MAHLSQNGKNSLISLVIYTLFCALLLFVILLLTSCGSAKASSSPGTLEGHWHQVENGIPHTFLEADISGNTIEIKLAMDVANDTMRGIYWAGSFDPLATNGMIIESAGDESTMSTSLLASSQETKDFKYENGKISFLFKIMGDETTVYLGR